MFFSCFLFPQETRATQRAFAHEPNPKLESCACVVSLNARGPCSEGITAALDEAVEAVAANDADDASDDAAAAAAGAADAENAAAEAGRSNKSSSSYLKYL